MPKRIGRPPVDGVGVKRIGLTLTPQAIKDLQALADRLTAGNKAAMVRRLIKLGREFYGPWTATGGSDATTSYDAHRE